MVDRFHATIVGDSGNGKTTLMRELFHDADGNTLWVNHNDERGLSSNTAKSLEGLKGQYERSDGNARLVLLPGENVGPEEMAAIAMEFAIWLSEEYYEGIRIFFDEAHNYMPTGDESKQPKKNPVAWGIHEGRDKEVAVTLGTQTPRQIEYQPLGNMKYWAWVGQQAGIHGSFLDHSIANWFPTEQFPEERFKYIVFDNRGDVLFKGETKEEHA